MQLIRIDSLITAFIRPEEGVNASFIHTPAGIIVVDTTSSPAEARSLFEATSVRLDEVRFVINTHSHSDHTWGNQVFSCPILAHWLCKEQMQTSLRNEWSQKSLHSYLIELENTEPPKAENFRKVLDELKISLPSLVFDDRYEWELGGVKIELIHLGGHTPDLSVVWLPESRILFASDLIFQGRYPYIFDADIPLWIKRLDSLLDFGASQIIPGHGVMCGEAEINALRQYLQDTWELTQAHIRLGHSADETASDPNYPCFAEQKYERLHKANIRYMYKMVEQKKS
jgi:cyclase